MCFDIEWNEFSIIFEDKCVFINGIVYLKCGLINVRFLDGIFKGKIGRVIRWEIFVKKD